MRTSRVSQETSRAIKTLSNPSSPRKTRSTRSSLARFALNSKVEPDIEDAVPDAPSLKRKRPARSTASSSAHFTTEKDADEKDLKTEVKSESEESDVSALSPPPSSDAESDVKSEIDTKPSNKKARQPAKRIRKEATLGTIKPPDTWKTVYKLVQEMRKLGGIAHDAAVDTMGCHALALPTVSERDKRFQTLIALMLSSQTKDTTTYLAMRNLQTNLPSGLNIESILEVEAEKLNEMIHSVGFHNNKTKYIKATAIILRDQFDSDIPTTVEGLMSLPGVGPKMAYLCMSAAWGKIEGIGVDVHVHRICNMWHWAGSKETSNPEGTRLALQSWLPREKWGEINHLLVGFGQTICAPEVGRRRCGECLVGLEGLCRVADRKKVNAGRKAREEGLKIEYEEKEIVKKEGRKTKVEKVEEMKVVKDEPGGEERVLDTVPKLEDIAEGAKVEVKDEEPSRDMPISEALKEEKENELKEE